MIKVLKIHPNDNVCVATQALAVGTEISVAGITFTLGQDVQLGAKLALRPIARGEKVLKYGEPIGSATKDLELGDYIHTHNLESDYLKTFARGESIDKTGQGGTA